jgi:hypothetical protein
MRQRHRAVAGKIDAISRLVRQGRAEGDIILEHEEDDLIYDFSDRLPRYARRRTHVTIELELYDYELDFLDEAEEPTSRAQRAEAAYQAFAAPKKQVCKCPEVYACPLHNWQHKDFGNPAVVLPPEPPDYRGAVDRLVRIIKVIEKAEATKWSVGRLVAIIRVIERAWAMDDSSKRFKMLELD